MHFFLLIVVYLTMLNFNYLNVSSEQVQLSALMNAPFLFVFNCISFLVYLLS